MSKIKEPTLPYDHMVLMRNVGFRSPLRVAAKFWLMAFAGKVRRLEYRFRNPHFNAYGWERDGVRYITRVTP